MLRQRSGRARGIELPCGQRASRRALAARDGGGALGDEELGHVQPLERRGGVGRRRFGEREQPRCEIEPRDAGPVAARIDGDEQRVALRVEQIGVGHRARGDHAQHLALDRTLARRGIADLLADRDRLAEAHQFREIAVDGVVRHAGHRNRRAGRLPARGERDVEQARGALRVVVEELVEVAHPVEQQLVRMLRLGAEVLLHHGRVPGERRGGGVGSGVHRRIIRAGSAAPRMAPRPRLRHNPVRSRARSADAHPHSRSRPTDARGPAPPLVGTHDARGRRRREAGGRGRGIGRRPRHRLRQDGLRHQHGIRPPRPDAHRRRAARGAAARAGAVAFGRHRAEARRCRGPPRRGIEGGVARARPLGRALVGDRGARRARQCRRDAVSFPRRARWARPATWRRSRIFRRC